MGTIKGILKPSGVGRAVRSCVHAAFTASASSMMIDLISTYYYATRFP